MLTFVLCGIIAGCVLAVVALYVIRRHTRSKEKLRQLAGGNPDQLEASKDYQVGSLVKTLSISYIVEFRPHPGLRIIVKYFI